MKILFFMDIYIFGGCEKMLKIITDYLLEKGNKVDLLVLYRSDKNTYLKELDPRVGVKYIWDIDGKNSFIRRIVFWMNVLFPYIPASRIPANQYDWVINFKDNEQTNIIASKFKTRKISWVHNIMGAPYSRKGRGLKCHLSNYMYRIVHKKYLRSFSKFDSVICVSQHAKSSLEERADVRSTVIYNYADYQKISKMAQESISDVLFDRFTYCYIGRLSEEKGVAEATEIVCHLIQEGKNVQLLIIGEGEELERLQLIVKRFGCQDRVLFLGAKQNPYPYLRKSDVILCPSHRESFGLVVLESILLKRWIVSTRCGGPEELIRDGENGFLVSTYEEFEDRLVERYRNRIPVKENSLAAYQNLQEKFYQDLNQLLHPEEGKENEDSVVR